MSRKETPVNQLLLEKAYFIEHQTKKEADPKIGEKLEEWGLIEAKGKKIRKFKRLTTKGIKEALNISLVMEE